MKPLLLRSSHLLLIAFLIGILGFLQPVHAVVTGGTGKFVLSPATELITIGQPSLIEVQFNTNNVPVSGVQFRLSIPVSNNDVTVSSVAMNSALTASSWQPYVQTISPVTNGVVNIDFMAANMGLSGYTNTTNTTLATITLTANSTFSNKSLVFDTSLSKMLKKADATDILGSPANGSYSTTGSTVPTVIPTNVPTLVPTAIPTNVPTGVPTTVPTNVPTLAPTSIPTNVPTAVPTNVNATNTPIPPTSTPTSSGCIQNPPNVSMSPNQQTGTVAQSLNYQLRITNSNSGSCAPATYNITIDPPNTTNWSTGEDNAVVTLVNGGNTTVNMSISPSSGVPSNQNYTFTAHVTGINGALSAQSQGSYQVTTTVVTNPPGWWFIIPNPLRGFLEELYLFVFYWNRPTNNVNLLQGVPTPTPTSCDTTSTTSCPNGLVCVANSFSGTSGVCLFPTPTP